MAEVQKLTQLEQDKEVKTVLGVKTTLSQLFKYIYIVLECGIQDESGVNGELVGAFNLSKGPCSGSAKIFLTYSLLS